MKAFTDQTTGQTWEIKLDILAAGRLRDLGIVDLFDDEQLIRVHEDPHLVFKINWELCKSQAEKYGVSPEQFSDLLTTNFVQWLDVFRSELVSFCQSLDRGVQATMLTKIFKAQQDAINLGAKKLASEQLDAAISFELNRAECEMDEMIKQMGGKSSGRSPEPSE